MKRLGGRASLFGSASHAFALLWYPPHYEGSESYVNVIYAGAAPNSVRLGQRPPG
ncbi:MAG: transporter substrate-binding protein [Acetobacteraceae bacterium]